MSNAKQETIADIVVQLRAAAHIQNADSPRDVLKFADRIEAAEKRADDQWRAAFAKIEAVVTLQYAKRNLGDKGKIAVAEIMSACRFPDGALDEYERAFSENARLRAALKPVLDIEIDMNTSDLAMSMAIKEAKRIYNEGKESEVK